jgi:uncharacterized membrane protein SirB2
MSSLYLSFKMLHVAAVIASGVLFFSRGALTLAGQSRWAQARPLRRLSWIIDSVLLLAALALVALLQHYPFVHGWLTAKVVLLLAYIGCGAVALHRAGSRRQRVAWFAAAIAIYLAIIAIARFRHPLGPLGLLGG